MLNALFLIYLVSSSLTPFHGAMSAREEGDQLIQTEQLSWAILELTKAYVKPSRFDPSEMVVHALRGVESVVPDLIFDESGLPNQIHLRMAGAPDLNRRVTTMGSIWEAFMVLKASLDYVGRHMPADVSAQDVELRAINGILETLDPHSVMFSPQEFEEMKVSTQGQFGGLGIVIGQRDGWLTVISPIPDTPASKAGVKAHDQIIRINDETTENMSLEEAVSRLRGAPGTKVTVWIRRKGMQGPLVKELVRQIIKVHSVSHKVLADGVGYLRLKGFRENTTDEAVAALSSLRQAGATRGLILDMRDNPGGLLDQAVSISDLFLKEGVIVTTEGFGDQMSQPRYAHQAGSLSDIPMVVLISAGSASASEIVAGALRNHQRALVLGQNSFGKGSVQTIIPFRPRRTKVEGTALKLTIAHYLTPGGVSIQGTGIVPDIRLEPVHVTEEHLALKPSEVTREVDLDRSLGHRSTQEQKVRSTLSYLAEEELEQDEQTRQESAGKVQEDFEVRMARRLLLAGGAVDVARFFKQIEMELKSISQEQDALIVAALKARKIDWAMAPENVGDQATGVAKLIVPVAAKAGETVPLKLCVKNNSKSDLYRVVGRSISAHSLLNEREFVIGRVAPGTEVCRKNEVELPKTQLNRQDYISLKVTALGGRVRVPAPTPIRLAEALRPTMDYQVSYIKNQDGLVSPGEAVELRVAVRVKDHDAGNLLLALRNRNGSAVKMTATRVRNEEVTAGGVWVSTLRFEARDVSEALEFDLNLGAGREGVWYGDRIVLPVANQALPRSACKQARVSVLRDTQLRLGASIQSRPLADLQAGDRFECLSKAGSWWRVADRDGTQGFLPGGDASPDPGRGSKAKLKGLAFDRKPPEIQLDSSGLSYEVIDDMLLLKGRVRSESKLKNLIVYRRSETGRKKVAIVSGGKKDLSLQLEIPLEPGQNLISIQALEDIAYGSSHSFWVLSRKNWDPLYPTKHHRSEEQAKR